MLYSVRVCGHVRVQCCAGDTIQGLMSGIFAFVRIKLEGSVVIFKTESQTIPQAGLKLVATHLPQLLEC